MSLWADKFDDNFTNIFAVQDAISERIADALALQVTETERQHLTKRSTENTEAYQLYLRGQYLATKRFGESGHQAIEYYEQAVGKDPDYAAAYAAMAYSCVLQAGEGGDEGGAEGGSTHGVRKGLGLREGCGRGEKVSGFLPRRVTLARFAWRPRGMYDPANARAYWGSLAMA